MAPLTVYGAALDHLTDADVDWVADTIKGLIATNAYTPDQDAHDFRNDVTNEASGGGYSAGGATLANKTSAYNAGTNTTKLDADDLSWSNITLTNARYVVLYKARGGASSADELIGWVDLGSDMTGTFTTFVVTWNAAGIIEVSTP